MTEQPLYIIYRNWRGETDIRHVFPKSVYFGLTQWHPVEQWFMLAHDEAKGATRDFAMNDILSMHSNFDDAQASLLVRDQPFHVALGDEFLLNGTRIKVDAILPPTPRTEPTAYMPALPAASEAFVMMDMDGPNVGGTTPVSEAFLRVYCTRVR